METTKITLSVELQNNRWFFVWRRKDGKGIASLYNEVIGGYLVNRIRVLHPDFLSMKTITTFSDLDMGIIDTENYIKQYFGECKFADSESYTKWKKYGMRSIKCK